MPSTKAQEPSLRRRVYVLLEHGVVGDRRTSAVSRALVLLILINLIAVTLQSVPAIDADYGPLFFAIEIVSLVVFTVEYALRLWVASEHEPYAEHSPLRARWHYATSLPGLVDLVAVLPFWLAFVAPADLRVLLVFRVVRFLKLARYSPGVRSLLDALYEERRALGGCLIILLGATLLAASVMHMVERNVQPDKFGTIPDAMWWAIVTLGTIGYGDVVPVTALGRLVAAVTIVASLIMIALPVGIVATAFAEQIHRRDFIVTWGIIARVPLFSGLTAGEIADVMRLLRAETVPEEQVITRRGEPAHSMYFIAHGEVEIELEQGPIRLGMGQFFGEMAVLRRAPRSATAFATRRTSLLVLAAADLHALMERQPRIAERIRATVRDRTGGVVNEAGEVVVEESEHKPAGRAEDVKP
ncbi:MAG: cyclic nucleotide-gated ion channel [Xanthobacteraceae bacterium]